MPRWISLELLTLLALGIYIFLIPRSEFTLLDTVIIAIASLYVILSLLKVMMNKK
jgi:hypothetical protein